MLYQIGSVSLCKGAQRETVGIIEESALLVGPKTEVITDIILRLFQQTELWLHGHPFQEKGQGAQHTSCMHARGAGQLRMLSYWWEQWSAWHHHKGSLWCVQDKQQQHLYHNQLTETHSFMRGRNIVNLPVSNL